MDCSLKPEPDLFRSFCTSHCLGVHNNRHTTRQRTEQPVTTGELTPVGRADSSLVRSHSQSRHNPSACARTSWPASKRSCPHNRRPAEIACCRGDDAVGRRTVAACPSRRLALPEIACRAVRRRILLRCSFPSPESLGIRLPARPPRLPLFLDAASFPVFVYQPERPLKSAS